MDISSDVVGITYLTGLHLYSREWLCWCNVLMMFGDVTYFRETERSNPMSQGTPGNFLGQCSLKETSGCNGYLRQCFSNFLKMKVGLIGHYFAGLKAILYYKLVQPMLFFSLLVYMTITSRPKSGKRMGCNDGLN